MKSKMVRFFYCGLIGLLGIAGCSSGGGRPSVAVTEANYCAQVAAVACYNMFQCCTGAKIEEVLGITISTNESECRHDVQLICEQKNVELAYALVQNTVLLETDQATACLKSLLLMNDTCFVNTATMPWAEPCKEDPFTGLQPTGSACLYSFECEKNHYCDNSRKCRTLPAAGEPCGRFSCSEGLFCDRKTDTCENLLSLGGSCDGDYQCQPQSYCGADSNNKFKCMPLKDLRSVCEGDHECVSNYCLPGVCDSGEACFVDSDCVGACNNASNSVCQNDSSCPSHCKVTTSKSCFAPDECPEADTLCGAGGKCTDDTTVSCSYDSQCPTYDDMCQHYTCVQKCFGQPVCAESYGVANYCDATLNFLVKESN
jgi:hypothetical protein